MAENVKTAQGLAIASVKTLQGLAIASAKTILGVDNTGGGARPDPGDYGTCVQALWGDDAPSGSVATWPFDTYGSDATQATSGARPTRVDGDLGGHHVLSFDGDDWMSYTPSSPSKLCRTVCVVFNHNDGNQDYADLIGNASEKPLHGGAGTDLFAPGFFNPAFFASGTIYEDGSSTTYAGIQKSTSYHCVICTSATTVVFDTLATMGGDEVNFPARLWNGRIAAVILFEDQLDATNAGNLSAALDTYFGGF